MIVHLRVVRISWWTSSLYWNKVPINRLNIDSSCNNNNHRTQRAITSTQIIHLTMFPIQFRLKQSKRKWVRIKMVSLVFNPINVRVRRNIRVIFRRWLGKVTQWTNKALKSINSKLDKDKGNLMAKNIWYTKNNCKIVPKEAPKTNVPPALVVNQSQETTHIFSK